MIRKKITEYLMKEFSCVSCESCAYNKDPMTCTYCKRIPWELNREAAEKITDKIIRIILRHEDEQ